MVHRQNSGSGQYSKSSNSASSGAPVNSQPKREFYFLTLFPEIFEPVLNFSLLGKAKEQGLVSFNLIQIRDFARDKHKTVDDTPYGGGEGMVLKADVLHAAWKKAMEKAPQRSTVTILLSPQGELFNQKTAKELVSTYSRFILVAGHYEGVDERFVELCVDREISVGNYVLTGGELPSLVLADVLIRLFPGVVGNVRSLSEESLEKGLLKYPQYTKPREYEGMKIPDVLLSGNHEAIGRWREAQMLERTRKKRPDLFKDLL